MSVEEMVSKKEQIAEALRTTQMMLTKHSDKYVEKFYTILLLTEKT